MEWGSESGAVRRHRVGSERREESAAATTQPERETPAQELPADARGSGTRTRKRSQAGGGGAGSGLSEARAALGLAFYLLVLWALVQLSLQQLVLRRPAGHRGEFNARQARYRPGAARASLRGPGAQVPCVSECTRGGHVWPSGVQTAERGVGCCRV